MKFFSKQKDEDFIIGKGFEFASLDIDKKEDKKASPIKQNNTDITEVYSCITKEQLQALLDSNVKNIAFDIFSREIGTTPSKDLYKFFDRDLVNLVIFFT